MYKLKYTLLISLIFLTCGKISAGITGISNIDSLKNIIKTSEYDTLVCHAYASWGAIIYGANPDSAILLWETAIKLAKKNIPFEENQLVKDRYNYSIAQCANNLGLVAFSQGRIKDAEKYLFLAYKNNRAINDKVGVANSINSLAYFYGNTGQINKSINFHNRSLKLFESVDRKKEVAAVLTNLAYRYNQIGQVEKSLKVNYEALKIKEELGDDPKSIAYSINNIAFIYDKQGDQKKALEYFNKALEYREKLGDKIDIADTYNNIGKIYVDKQQYKIALEYFNKAINLYREVTHKSGLAISFLNIGNTHRYLKENKKALDYYFMGHEIAVSTQDKSVDVSLLVGISRVYLDVNNLSYAESYAKEALKISRSLNMPELINESSLILSKIYQQNGKSMQALEMYKLHIEMRDSLKNENTQKAAIQQQAKYEYEKQKAVDDAEYEKEIAIEQKAKEKQTILTYATGGGLGLVGIFLLIVFNRLKVTRKQKNIIEEQKQEVEYQKEVVEKAHSKLEEKTTEITDSIQYAKRIQNAILPSSKVVKEYLTESFILYKPKDIVAGDFYWLEPIKNSVLFAAADCTGHGVPGAMVSVVCNNGLNRSVREYGLTDPGKILDKAREIVVEEFEKSEEEVKDGMDIALCSLEGNKLHFAGAHNPLWIIRNGELLETKANKQPIGKFDNPEPYTTHTIKLQKGDSIYIFSDGYADQFGGEKGKKLKSANFKKLLLSIQKENMQKQKELIDEAFEKWKGNQEQLDDVCVIGVKV